MGIVVPNRIDSNINGVELVPLKQIVDERGKVMHMLRSDAPVFSSFGEIYFSRVLPGVVKAWKRHFRMTQYLAVPDGKILLVIFDDRDESPSKGEILKISVGQPDRYYLVKIPPMLWYGFKGLSEKWAMIANCPDMPHDPEEVKVRSMQDTRIPYKW